MSKSKNKKLTDADVSVLEDNAPVTIIEDDPLVVEVNGKDVTLSKLEPEIKVLPELEVMPEIKVEIETTTEVVDVDSQKSPGRPVVSTSVRQQRLLDQELKRLAGGIKKGRPVSSDSKRQVKTKEMNEKRAAGLLKPGRPKFTAAEKLESENKKAARKLEEDERIKALAAEMMKSKEQEIEISV